MVRDTIKKILGVIFLREQLNNMELRESIMDFLQEHVDGSLATVKDSIPRSSPVRYFMGDDMEIYILSAGGEKFNAIDENPNVCLLVNSEYLDHRRIKGVQIFGKATTSINEPDLYHEAIGYSPDPFLMEREKNYLEVIKIEPEEIVYLDALKEGDRTKQILKGDEVILHDDYTTIDDLQTYIPSMD